MQKQNGNILVYSKILLKEMYKLMGYFERIGYKM